MLATPSSSAAHHRNYQYLPLSMLLGAIESLIWKKYTCQLLCKNETLIGDVCRLASTNVTRDTLTKMSTITAASAQALRDLIDQYTTVENPKLPGIVYCAFGQDSLPLFQHASGKKGLSTTQPMTLNTTFWLLSFTKLVTSIACMQCVERGLLKLDDADQLEELAPELRHVQVLQRTAEGDFHYVPNKSRTTFRMLLNHTGISSKLQTASICLLIYMLRSWFWLRL